MKAKEFEQIRQRKGWTLERLADYLRSNVRSVARWENGDRRISGPVAVLMEMLAAQPEAAE